MNGIVHSVNRRLTLGVVPALVVVLSVAVGLAIVSYPSLAVIPIALLAAALLITDGRVRTAFVIFGGLFLLQRDDAFSSTKLAFLAGMMVAFAGAFLNVRALRRSAPYDAARPLLAAAVALFALGVLSLAFADANAIPKVAWLRDVAPLFLLASVPVFALDAQVSFSRRALVGLLVAVGMLMALTFAITWLERRSIATFGAGRLGLASVFPPAALFAYCMAVALHERARRARWLLVAGLILALLVATGNRSTLVLLVAPVAIAFGARRYLATRTVRLAFLAPLAVAATLVFALVIVGVTGANMEYLNKRLEILQGTGQSASDASYNERIQQSNVAWNTLRSAPAFGTGPGTTFEWTTQDRRRVESPLLDTPLTFPAKFGLLGLLVLAFVVAKYISFVRRMRRGRDPTIPQLALIGYLMFVVVITPLVMPLDDKGLSFGLILLVALALQELNGPARQAFTQPGGSGADRTL